MQPRYTVKRNETLHYLFIVHEQPVDQYSLPAYQGVFLTDDFGNLVRLDMVAFACAVR